MFFSRRVYVKCAVSLLLAGVTLESAWSHHSSAVYDMTKKVTAQGTVTKLMWVNPHAYFQMDATGANGAVEHWEFLLNSPNEMQRAGWDRHTIKPGDVITVTAYPGRGDPTRAFCIFATFPDGRKVLTTEK
jgi:hypothetical protein